MKTSGKLVESQPSKKKTPDVSRCLLDTVDGLPLIVAIKEVGMSQNMLNS